MLDLDTPVLGVTTGTPRPEAVAIAVPSTIGGSNMTGDDFALTAGWGHFGSGEAVMPGQGRVVERTYTPEERAALGGGVSTLGETTCDIYLNDCAYLAQPPRRCIKLQAEGLSGPQEVALLSREGRTRPNAAA